MTSNVFVIFIIEIVGWNNRVQNDAAGKESKKALLCLQPTTYCQLDTACTKVRSVGKMLKKYKIYMYGTTDVILPVSFVSDNRAGMGLSVSLLIYVCVCVSIVNRTRDKVTVTAACVFFLFSYCYKSDY